MLLESHDGLFVTNFIVKDYSSKYVSSKVFAKDFCLASFSAMAAAHFGISFKKQ